MQNSRKIGLATMLLAVGCFVATGAGTKVTVDENGVMVIDGKKTFIFSVSLPPKPDGKTPEGTDAFAELKDAGLNFMRIRPTVMTEEFKDWGESGVRSIGAWLDAAARQRMHCWITLGPLPAIKPGDIKNEKLLRLAIELYKDHPGLGGWKAFDEVAWVKMPAGPMLKAYQIFKELDPNHPVIVIQAPEHHALPLEDYVPVGDIMGVDIFPVKYPPGKHGDFTNGEISVVADATQ